ncbi:MAG: hypothetical protein ACLRWP_18510 [Bilophila wadsworthia]
MYSRIRISGERQAVFPVRQTPSGTVAFFCQALGGILPLDALAIVRMEGKKACAGRRAGAGRRICPKR